jgi:hypothetical protein
MTLLTPALKVELGALLEHWCNLEAEAGDADEGRSLLSRSELVERQCAFRAAMRSLDLEAVRRVVWAFDDELTPLRHERDEERNRWRDDHDSEYEHQADDDPNAAGSPAPLVVVRSRTSGPRVAAHPYQDSKQYQQAQKVARKASAPTNSRDRDREIASLEAVYGERGDRPAYGIGRTGRTGNKPGRPPGANPRPARAVEHLEADTGRPITELRAFRSKGKPNSEQKALRATLAPIVAAILSSKRSTVEALAEALECSPSAVKRLRAK